MHNMRLEFEQQARRICGERIARVRYFEIAYEDGKPRWRREFGDVLDFGLDLETSNGRAFQVTWDSRFFAYGLSLQEGHLEEHLSAAAVWDVTEESRWSQVVNQTVRDVAVYWSEVESDGSVTCYPQDMALIFESGAKVFLSASQYVEDTDELFGMSDEVAVIFDEETAERYQVGKCACAP
jgi:hypothetical protein